MSRRQTRSPDPSSPQVAAGRGVPEADVRRAVAMPAAPADPGAALAPSGGAATAPAESGRPDERQPEAAVPVRPAASSPARAGGVASLLGRRAGRSESAPAAEGGTRARAADTAETEAMPVTASAAAATTAAGSDREDDGDGFRGGNPKKPLLAAAGLAGVVLIGMPLLILATDDDEKKSSTVSVGQTTPRPDEGVVEVPQGDYAPQEPSEEPSAEGEESATPEAARKKDQAGAGDAKATAKASPSAEPSPETRKPSSKKVTVLKRETSAPTSKAPSVRTFTLVSSDTGKCLTGSATAATQLVVRACDGSAAQQWKFANDGTIRTKGMCLDLYDGTKSTEAKVEVWPCNGEAWQQFQLNAAGELVSTYSGHCLDVWHGKSDGTKVTTWLCNGQPNQRWSRA
ncbi:ricin-type beta-trefoil lectin domain protein [Streptomyces sp. AC627_RSS907]|uniref:ricin-type beta-trefoil lectin domain protein n=1 Tax=Streptomyces sp. AC627_RSS907 TaxID=2823684 RepID=UPI001C27171B|nr:ricin-type beta-trefoil lectin domain protein [Streptomyces sp. AC627_RSS907]